MVSTIAQIAAHTCSMRTANTTLEAVGLASFELPRETYLCIANGMDVSNAVVANVRDIWGMSFPMGREGGKWRTPTTAYWIAYRQQICKWETQTSLALVFRDIA